MKSAFFVRWQPCLNYHSPGTIKECDNAHHNHLCDEVPAEEWGLVVSLHGDGFPGHVDTLSSQQGQQSFQLVSQVLPTHS